MKTITFIIAASLALAFVNVNSQETYDASLKQASSVASEDNVKESKKWNSVYLTDHALEIAGHALKCDEQDRDTQEKPSCVRRQTALKTGRGTYRESVNLSGVEIQATKMVVHADGSATFY